MNTQSASPGNAARRDLANADAGTQESDLPGRRRLLVVEDVPSLQQLLAVALRCEGHRVVTASSGAEAVALISEQPFDLVLMDIQMPGMSGLDATRAIRAQEELTGGHVPIVAVTACVLNGDAEACAAAGTDAYLEKPIDFAELRDIVCRLARR